MVRAIIEKNGGFEAKKFAIHPDAKITEDEQRKQIIQEVEEIAEKIGSKGYLIVVDWEDYYKEAEQYYYRTAKTYGDAKRIYAENWSILLEKTIE